jgi:hypothetical protein
MLSFLELTIASNISTQGRIIGPSVLTVVSRAILQTSVTSYIGIHQVFEAREKELQWQIKFQAIV